MTLSEDKKLVEEARARGGRQSILGSKAELQETMGQFVEAGVDEFIVPDFNLGRSVGERKESYDRFLEDVAKPFR